MKNKHPANYRANKYHHSYVLVTALILVAVCIVVVLWRLQPPAPLGTNASPELFSAMRAIEELRQVLAVETPHIVVFLVAAVGACLAWFPMAFRFEAFMSFDFSPAGRL